jgi:hypothetical protein
MPNSTAPTIRGPEIRPPNVALHHQDCGRDGTGPPPSGFAQSQEAVMASNGGIKHDVGSAKLRQADHPDVLSSSKRICCSIDHRAGPIAR